MLGCPHNSDRADLAIARLLDGKQLQPNTQLWVLTPRAIREVADRSGYTNMIADAGGMS